MENVLRALMKWMGVIMWVVLNSHDVPRQVKEDAAIAMAEFEKESEFYLSHGYRTAD